jgi:hypothetical protein
MPEFRPPNSGFDRTIRHSERHELARGTTRHRKISLRPRETLATLMFGAGSLCLSIVMMIVIVMGLCGSPIEPWSELQFVWVEKTPREYTRTRDPFSNEYVATPVLVKSRQIAVPSRECHALAFLSLILGGGGLCLSLSRRHVSWLSAAGFTLTFLMMGVVLSSEMLLRIAR